MIECFRKLPRPALAMMVANVVLLVVIVFSPLLMLSLVCLMGANGFVIPAATAARHGPDEMRKILAFTSVAYILFATLGLLPFLFYFV